MFLSKLSRLSTSKFYANCVTYSAFHTSAMTQAKVAVILSGCGVYDGTEVHEASAILVHLSRAGSEVGMFAPNIDQMHVINHTKGEPMEQTRNVLEESARIARGKISALSELDSKKFDAVIFPGGFGAAKNLSSFATEGTSMKVNQEVEKTLKDFYDEKKPIGLANIFISSVKFQNVLSQICQLFRRLCCISPVIAAKVISGCELTVGSDQEEGGKWPYAGTAGAIETMGSKHIKKSVTECHTDEKNKIVTTPAFMCETKLHEIFDGIGVMVHKVLSLAK